MSEIVWLASYPKSGSTWFRVFFENLFRDAETPVSINAIPKNMGFYRYVFDALTGVESADLTPDEIERLQPKVYEAMARGSAHEPLVIKIHDAYRHNSQDRPLFPASVTRGVIYVARNPFDVCVSWGSHFGVDLDTAIDQISRQTFTSATSPTTFLRNLRQYWSSWSGHALSWLDPPRLPIHVVRYEDMKREPQDAFTRAVEFLGLSYDREQIARAIEFSSFENLRSQEESEGFRERPKETEAFFRLGKVGGWRDALTREQIERVTTTHERVMKRFGYLSEQGELLI